MRGFIDDELSENLKEAGAESQSAFVRGFIDDSTTATHTIFSAPSQSAFVRGFIDDGVAPRGRGPSPRLNPRSCAASSMTKEV